MANNIPYLTVKCDQILSNFIFAGGAMHGNVFAIQGQWTLWLHLDAFKLRLDFEFLLSMVFLFNAGLFGCFMIIIHKLLYILLCHFLLICIVNNGILQGGWGFANDESTARGIASHYHVDMFGLANSLTANLIFTEVKGPGVIGVSLHYNGFAFNL